MDTLKKKILIVCFDDISLAPMIKELLVQALKEKRVEDFFEVTSAGLESHRCKLGASATTSAQDVVGKDGPNISKHQSYFVGNLSPGLRSYHLVITTNQESLGLLLKRHNSPRERTILLFDETGGIHLSPGDETHAYQQCVSQLKPEMRKLAESLADELHLVQMR